MSAKKLNSREVCQYFANRHKVVFDDHGECGFGRPCVGFIKGESYVAHNPLGRPDLEPLPDFADERLYPGDSAPDAYHKHNCLAVLVHGDDYDKAIDQLAAWVKKLESLGEVEIADYSTGAVGIQALLSGVIGHAIRIKSEAQ